MSQTERVEIALIGTQRPPVREALEQHFVVHPICDAADPMAALRAVGHRIRGAASHGMAGLSRLQMAAMPNLEICAINGVGLETTDLQACKEQGVVVTTAPVLFDDVADLALALALAASRRIPAADEFVRSGRWLKERMSLGRKFTGMRAGIIGLGRIGLEVARRLEGFKAEINFADPMQSHETYVRRQNAIELAEHSDILFMCAAGPARGTGKPIVTKEVIDALGPRGIFINVSRGWLVDEEALVRALVEERLGAAGLDVFDQEPNVPAALLDCDRVVLTPHIASSTVETMGAMGECVVANLRSWFAGEGALTPVAAE
jgi:lactate dehydrogenase-like 2-hydroxyacid dehydrogenase